MHYNIVILLTMFDLVKHSPQVYNRAIEVVSVTSTYAYNCPME